MIVDNGYIVAIERKDEKFGKVVELINNPPTAPSGYRYRLRADNLEWELVELPPAPEEDEEATAEDYEAALREVGVDV